MNEVLRDDAFWLAFALAGCFTVAAVALARLTTARLAFATVALVASYLALTHEFDLGARVGVGVLFVAIAGLLEEHGAGGLVSTAVRVCGAVLVVFAPAGVSGWARALALVVIVTVVPLAGVVDQRAPRLVPVLVVISVVGVYVCVPDTELPRLLLGAVLPAALLALERDARRSASTGALLALVVYAVLVGGIGRSGSVVGGLACLAALALPSLAGWVDRARADAAVLVVTHAAVVLWVARVAGLRDSAWVALALCIPAFVVGVVALVVVRRRALR